MWESVRVITGKTKAASTSTDFNATQLNEHYAAISHDKAYVPPCKKPLNVKEEDLGHISEESVFHLLDTLAKTSQGTDGLPHWFLHLAAPSISLPVTHLYNLSVAQAQVPCQWKSSVITPVPKVTKPKSCSDFRPISVSSILSRLLEKILIRKFIYPALQEPSCKAIFDDQFAFRPTGSCTSALIHLTHQASSLLQDFPHVHLISLDYSKAFDTCRHSTFSVKLSDLPIPAKIHNWLVDYLTGRQHCTKFQGSISVMVVINASFVQGSGIGPVAFIIQASDLHPKNPGNYLDKYADDMYLLVPSVNSHLIPEELKNIVEWAAANNLSLNEKKTAEMVLHKKGTKGFVPPPPLLGITRVESMVILGVTVNDTLTFDDHVCRIISLSSQSLYALRVLRSHGLEGAALWDVTRATLVSKMLYASPVWWGSITAAAKQRLQSLLSKLQRVGFLPQQFSTFAELCEQADRSLFASVISNPAHVLASLLPPIRRTGYDLRKRAHDHLIPRADSIMRRNFIIRMLYAF